VPAYLRNCRHNVFMIRDALDRDDFDAVSLLGHQMRGSGGMFGFQSITNHGADIEQAAEDADQVASRRGVDALSLYLDGLDIVEALQ